MLHYVLSLHVHLVDLSIGKEITEVRFILLNIELIFAGILTWRNENYGLIYAA